MKNNKEEWIVKLKKAFHFITTVLMYSICLIMLIVFLAFVVNFIDSRHNIKAGNNKKALFSAYTIVSPSMVPSINVLDVVVTKRVDNPEDLNNWFNSITYEQFKNILVHLNINLRNEKRKDKGIWEGYMTVNSNTNMYDMISPNNDVQEICLKNLYDSLKKFSSNKYKAELVYYYLTALHLFRDGNGRTSRLIYDLVKGADKVSLFENINWYIHDKDNKQMYVGSFEEARKIASINRLENAVSMENFKLFLEDVKEKFSLPSDIKSKVNISTYYRLIYNERNDHKEVIGFLPNKLKKALGREKTDELYMILLDSNSSYSVAGLTMLYVTLNNSTYSKWEEINNEMNSYFMSSNPLRYRLIFNLQRNKEFFESWTVNDGKLAIEYGNKLKKRTFDILIDLFVNPYKYMLKGEPVIEFLITQNNGHKK